MTTIEMPQQITQAEYIEAEAAYLIRRLADGDRAAAAVSAATLRHQLRLLLSDLDPDRHACSRIATENGRYLRWLFLDD